MTIDDNFLQILGGIIATILAGGLILKFTSNKKKSKNKVTQTKNKVTNGDIIGRDKKTR